MPVVAAMLLDAILGDSKKITHPVELIGKMILFFEKLFYGGNNRKINGLAFCASVLFTVGTLVFAALSAAAWLHPAVYAIFNIYLLYAAIAYRSLKDEALSVAEALAGGNLASARSLLSRIVGRDTQILLENGVARAAVETVAESYIDGVVSVVFYMTLGYFWNAAALLAWLFKAVSTMDSMVGYDDERYGNFGFAAAKLDDVLNFIPARLGAIIAVAAAAFSHYDYMLALKIFPRDRLKHKSPNSAHGESVFAGLLGISLGGGAYYDGKYEKRPQIGDDLRQPEPQDIWRACDILDRAYMLCMLVVLIITGGIYV